MDNELIRAKLLFALARKRKWGASHTAYEHIFRQFKSEALGKAGLKNVKNIGDEMMREGLILKKPTHYGLQVSLNPKKSKDEYRNRILNVHPAPLELLSGPRVDRLDVSGLPPRQVTILAESNRLARKLTGGDAVYDAVAGGEASTRSTIHIVTRDVDQGPILVQSRQFAIDPEARHMPEENLRSYADDLQERMKREGDGPAYLKALELIAKGRLSVDEETVFLDGNYELPYCGFRLDRFQ